MADPTVREIGENARAHLQHSTFDRVTGEIEEVGTPNNPVTSQIEDIETSRPHHQHPPNDPVADEIEAIETSQAQPQQPQNDPVAENNRRRIDPKLLRAIVNGDLISFKSILGTNVPTDIESTRVTNNGGNSVVHGVTCGENNALHVVAGVLITSQISLRRQILLYFLVLPVIYCVIFFFFIKYWGIGLILIFLMCCYIIINRVIIFISGHFPWIPQKIYEEAKRTGWLKWVLSFYKGRMYKEIADIIYHQDPTLLYNRNCAEETPLHCAANASNLHMVSLLIDFSRTEGQQKLDQLLRARNKVGETALHGAARSGYSGIVKELLCADKTVACLEDHNGISPLYLAVTTGCLDVVQQLIAAENPPTADENSPAAAENLPTADENQPTADENPPTAAGNPSTDAEYPPSYAGPDEQNALHAAVMKQKENIMTSSGALRSNKSSGKIMRVILEWNPSLAAKTDKAQNTPLHYAAVIGNTYAVRELLLKDTESVYKVNSSGSFPVHLAAEAGHVKVIKELLRMCPDVGELLDKEKKNFLHIAVEKKWMGVIMFACLEGNNANVINTKDKDGNTPLHLAVISSDSVTFDLLSQNKRVNPNIRNEAGLTPLEMSASLPDHQFTHSLNPQSIIHRALLTRGAFQNPCVQCSNLVNGRENCPNRREGKEMWNGVEVDIEKESTKYENMSKSLTTGAVLIASASFVAIFTVTGVYRDERATLWFGFFTLFVIADALAFILSIVSTIGLLYCALSDIQLRYRMYYFQQCRPLLYLALSFFILTYAFGVYIAIVPLSKWLASLIFFISVIAWFASVVWSPLIYLDPHMPTELLIKDTR